MSEHTNIPPERLREIREDGIAIERCEPFTDPHKILRSKRVLRRRGEAWAGAVLGRTFDRRSVVDSTYPWLNPGEVTALLLADTEEDLRALPEPEPFPPPEVIAPDAFTPEQFVGLPVTDGPGGAVVGSVVGATRRTDGLVQLDLAVAVPGEVWPFFNSIDRLSVTFPEQPTDPR